MVRYHPNTASVLSMVKPLAAISLHGLASKKPYQRFHDTLPIFNVVSLSTKPFRDFKSPVRTHLEASFPLRCFQRFIDFRNVATRACNGH